ncbi:MAG: site-2 protease family protein [Planctomycetaceae bacterium]
MEHHGIPSDHSPKVKVVDPDSIILIDARQEPDDFPPFQKNEPPQQFRMRFRKALFLFIATCLSTWFAQRSLEYTFAVMFILIAHEMGHFLQALRYGVPASLPYFIPMPITPLGTMGAVIVQGSGVADRKQMFDIAITGPLAGLVVALPILYFGLLQSEIQEIKPGPDVLRFGDPLILQWMAEYIHGPIPEGHDIMLTPLLFAGWVGILVTALNLIPIGQLDGGHILYCLLGKRAHLVAMAILWVAIVYMIATENIAYSLMIVLLLFMGPRHPPTRDDTVPLGWFRIILGWLTLAFIFVGFTPNPIMAVPQ